MAGGYKFNADLIDDLAKGRAALFLGAGVSSSATTVDGDRIKGWGDFLAAQIPAITDEADRQLAQELLDKKDYLLSCEVIKTCLGDDWDAAIAAEFQKAGTMSDLHKAILSLRQRIVITTNFDKYLESSMAAMPDTKIHPTVISDLEPDLFRLFRDDRSYIVKLHGTVDSPDKLIFAKSDYHDKAYGSWVYREFLDVMLLTHTMVFVGFSMDDPAISLLVEMYANKYKKCRPHYIFVGGSVVSRMKDISKRLRKLFIIDYDKKDNHAELLDMMQDLVIQTDDRRREIAALAVGKP